MHTITFAVRWLAHTNFNGLRLKVICSAADKTKTYGYYDCENEDGTFTSRDAEHNAVKRFIRDILTTEQPYLTPSIPTLRQIPQPTGKGDTLFTMVMLDKREVEVYKQLD